MRTEQLLRDALAEVADRPYPTENLAERILARTSSPPVRRRRAVLVLALVVVLVVAVALPTVLSRRSAAPADVRVRGNWNMIHRVDLPVGWTVTAQAVTADSESTSLKAPTSTADRIVGCVVEVQGPGRPDPAAGARRRVPVQVNGTPGYYVYPDAGDPDPSTTTSGGVTWRYATGAYAEVSCGEDTTLSLQMAARVRFGTVPTRLPFRLRSLPAGYQVQSVVPPLSTLDPPLLGAASLSAIDKSPERPVLGITVSPGPTEIPPGLPGWETDTIDGTPAVLSALDGRLCLNTRGHSVCIDAGSGQPADLTTSLWPAGRRELLVDVAKNLTLSRNLKDQSTWYRADQALPQ